MIPASLRRNSPFRRQLRLLAHKFNLAVSSRQRKNFAQPSSEGIEQIRKLLRESYFPSCFDGLDIDKFLDSKEGQISFENHLTRRLQIDRHGFVPWIESVIRLKDSTVLEIGCGTGSATIATAEQGAETIGLDVHREALDVCELRARVYSINNVSFVHGNAVNLETLMRDRHLDLIVFFASLEHMTIAERFQSLRAAWNILPAGKFMCITETPNRLWFHDDHTSRLPFYHWLPDELAFKYSKFSPRYPFNEQFDELNIDTMTSFIRTGRGFSYHEIDLSLKTGCEYKIVSDRMSFTSRHNPAVMAKRVAARDGKRERMLNAYAPDRHRAFFREHIDLIIQKLS